MAKNLPVNAGDADLIPGLGRSPEEGNVNPLQYSCLGSHTDRGAWWTTIHGFIKKLNMTATEQQQFSLPLQKKKENANTVVAFSQKRSSLFLLQSLLAYSELLT